MLEHSWDLVRRITRHLTSAVLTYNMTGSKLLVTLSTKSPEQLILTAPFPSNSKRHIH